MSTQYQNSLELSLAFFNCTSPPDLYSAVNDASPEVLEKWLDDYREFASAARLTSPALKEGELRPYCHNDSRWMPWSTGGLDSRGDSWKFVDGIKHRLLYSDSIAIDDSLGPCLADTVRRLKIGEDKDQ